MINDSETTNWVIGLKNDDKDFNKLRWFEE